jgi:hypothetical protein
MIMNCGYVGIRREAAACVNLRTELMCARSLSLEVARFQTHDCVLDHFRVNLSCELQAPVSDMFVCAH